MRLKRVLKAVLVVFALMIVSSPVLAARIYGVVYDENLFPMRSVLLDVNSTPHQRILIEKGDYEVFLDSGFYELKFTKLRFNDNETVTEHLIVNEGDGNYRFDVFFIPDLEDELLQDVDEIDPGLFEVQEKQSIGGVLFRLLEVVIVLGLLYLLYIGWKRIRKRKRLVEIKEEKQLEKIEKNQVTKDKIIEILKKNSGRMTQKELRKKIPYSEAKVSLLISEIESEGRIKRIKKGRGNILVLKE